MPPGSCRRGRFIATLPAGYATPVGEDGVRLSGGQRQRLAIARAFLADARLVILDEATSHLDPASEGGIRDAVERLAATRAVLVVSHRLRFVDTADLVVVLDRGRVVESGSPGSSLVATGRTAAWSAAAADRDRRVTLPAPVRVDGRVGAAGSPSGRCSGFLAVGSNVAPHGDVRLPRSPRRP